MSSPVINHLRRNLVRGLLTLLPLLITIWLLRVLFELVDNNVTPIVRAFIDWVGMPGDERLATRLGVSVISIVLTFLLIYGFGGFVAEVSGRRTVAWIEKMILRIPLIRWIYGSARQLLDAFLIGEQRHFSKVVLAEYPREGLWTVGFVTRETRHHVAKDGRPMTTVFLPTTPNPTSGWMILIPEDELVELDMSVEDGLKLIVSGGIVSPDDLATVLPGESSP